MKHHKFAERQVAIAGRVIDDNQPPYIVAEISANHGGTLQQMYKSIAMAKQCGADAVKIQVYSPESLTIDSEQEWFKIKKGLWRGRTLYELYESARTPYGWLKDIFEFGDMHKIVIFGTPFSELDIVRLHQQKSPAYKIASFELNDPKFIEKAGMCDRPLILSTGMSNTETIRQAYAAARKHGQKAAILHCVSAYPTKFTDMNLSRITLLRRRFPDAVIGLSDHSMTSLSACIAIGLGASIIEKHFILDNNFESPDKAFSLLPEEFTEFVQDCKSAYEAIGKATDENIPKDDEAGNLQFRRSIFVVKDIEKGEPFTSENIKIIRPGYGLNPRLIDTVLGKKAKKSIARGTPLTSDHLI